MKRVTEKEPRSRSRIGAQRASAHRGVVVPMVTPVANARDLDDAAVDRLIDFLLAGKVDGIFVLGTTGEGASVPRPVRLRLIQRTAKRVKGRALVYAGVGNGGISPIADANACFRAGADAVVACPPVSMPVDQVLPWFKELLDRLDGPLLLYNMPSTTNVSIPLEVVAHLLGHKRLAGIKDSENNPKRLETLLKWFGGQPQFSIFVGVGALMARGLRLGAVGIVPSVGNLIPDECRKLCASASRGDWAAANRHARRMNAVSALYQNGRTLGQSLAALKAALHCRGLCARQMLPPLVPVSDAELNTLRNEMSRLRLLNGAFASNGD